MYDLFVIGAGSGGVRAARIAASLGARVAIAEDTRLGGTCVNVGCVPKKLYHYAASLPAQVKLGQAYGWQVKSGSMDWPSFHAAKDKEILRLNGIYERLLESSGCEIVRGFASIEKADDVFEIKVAERTYQAKRVLLATGCKPAKPKISGAELAITSDELFAMRYLPKKMLVVGGGYIGCEMGSIFHELGVDVTLSVRSKILKGFDAETVDFLKNEFTTGGLKIIEGIQPYSLSKRDDDGIMVEFDAGNVECFDAVLMATGRTPRFESLGLENTQVTLDESGLIAVDDEFETAHQGIFALGDIIAGPELTPLALEQGMYLARCLFDKVGGVPSKPCFDKVATAIFTHPQMATVGMTEEAAIATATRRGLKVDIYTSSFRHIKYTVTDLNKRTFIKLIVESDTDKILGIHLVGHEVGEMMQGFAALVAAGGTKRQLDQTIGIHPTVAEELVTMREPTRQVG